MKPYIPFVFPLLLLSACIDGNPPTKVVYSIEICNTAPPNVKYYISKRYPDTAIGESNILSTVKPGGCMPEDEGEKWEEVFAEEIPGGKLMVFFFDPDTVNHYSWGDIRNGYRVRRKDVTLPELQQNDYKVFYP